VAGTGGDGIGLLRREGVTEDRLAAAWSAVREVMPPTPLVESPTLSARLGRPVWLKLEGVTPVRAFKVRGAIAKVAELEALGLDGPLVTASAGNHGLAVAFAGRRYGRPVTVFVPAAANPVKVAAIRGEGAEVVATGADYQEASEAALEHVAHTGAQWVHPFDDPAVIAGQATVGREIAEALPGVAQVVCAIGGGGLAAGVAAGLAVYAPQARLVGVEMDGADSMLRSVDAGHVVVLDAVRTVADGLAPRAVSERTRALVGTLSQALVRLTDDELFPAMRWLAERERVLAEPSGAATTAALLDGKVAGDGPVVAVVSGANVTPAHLRQALDAALPDGEG